MTPIFPSAAKLFEEKRCDIKKFDAVFYDIIQKASDGYFTIPDKDELAYLFVVGGRPYGSGRLDKQGLSFLDTQEFFQAYSIAGAADLAFHKVEKKLLLSMLVYFKKQPVHKFTADMVDMEKVLADLAQKGADSMIATRCGDEMGFCVCLKGKPSFNYLPGGVYPYEKPKEGLLLYIFDRKKCVPSIEVFDDIHMSPAPDAISAKDALPKSLIAHYIKKPAASSSVKGAEVILMLDDKVVNKYAITKTEITVGRAAGSDILIENPGVSRSHAVIREKDGKFIIEDKGSANGTFMKGQKITSAELNDGDRIQILNYALAFKYPQPAALDKTILLSEPAAQPEVKAKIGGQSKLVIEGGKEHILKSTVTTIGSGDDAELRLEGKGVEAHQASIIRGKGCEFVLVHKGGRTTTKINGEKMQEQHCLKNGDIIEIGQHKITYTA